MGSSSSKSMSEQNAQVYITQQFSGTCNVTCDNVMNNVSIDLINTNVKGNVTVSQSCSSNGTCMIGSNMDSVADVLFTAANSSNASNASNLYTGSFLNFDNAESSSRQDIKEAINQTSNETCNISSYNQMNNISIFAANSTIGGSISIDQSGNAQGQCLLNNSMSAAAYASGIAQNQSKSGKQKKGDKKAGKMLLFTYLIVGLVAIVIVYIIAKTISGHSKKSDLSMKEQVALEARARAGCPGGLQPIRDPQGKLIIDPRTKNMICPPPPIPGMQQPSSASQSSMQQPSSASQSSMQQPSSASQSSMQQPPIIQ